MYTLNHFVLTLSPKHFTFGKLKTYYLDLCLMYLDRMYLLIENTSISVCQINRKKIRNLAEKIKTRCENIQTNRSQIYFHAPLQILLHPIPAKINLLNIIQTHNILPEWLYRNLKVFLRQIGTYVIQTIHIQLESYLLKKKNLHVSNMCSNIK